MKDNVYDLKIALLNSHWPRCNELANELLNIGTIEAKEALIEGLKAKRHHARTASIKALVGFNDESIADVLEKYLSDPAYETRIETKKAINALTGRNVKTSKGE